MTLDAQKINDFQKLNEEVRNLSGEIVIENVYGERFIAAAATSDKHFTINGTPGNALGCYLDGADIVVNGNAQDAIGDTMNEGAIIVHGHAGDALGYGMRGGKIFIKGNSGYRTGIHMKQYKEKRPIVVVGGRTGSFLGEYMAGGLVIVLGIGFEDTLPVGYFTGTGIHGGEIFLRTKEAPSDLPAQVICTKAQQEDLARISDIIKEYCGKFGYDYEDMMNADYFLLTPNTKNPYKQLYTEN